MKRVSLLLVLAALVSFGGVALAQTGGGYDLSWWTIDGGGQAVSGGGYTLIGTVGQPEPGAALTGGGLALTGGFWPGAGSGGSRHKIYLPLALRLA